MKAVHLNIQKHRHVANIIGATYRQNISPKTIKDDEWGKIAAFIMNPSNRESSYGRKYPRSQGTLGYSNRLLCANASGIADNWKDYCMNGPMPTYLKAIDPASRAFPKEWVNAAISKLLDKRGIFVCPKCNRSFKGCAQLRSLQADHRVPYARHRETTWENLEILCGPCNLKK